jgi:hypothetical protein
LAVFLAAWVTSAGAQLIPAGQPAAGANVGESSFHSLTADQLVNRLVQTPNSHDRLVGPSTAAEQLELLNLKAREDRAYIRAYLRANPGTTDLLHLFDSNPRSRDPSVTKTSTGDYQIHGPGSNNIILTTQNEVTTTSILADAIRRSMDPRVQLRAYGSLYDQFNHYVPPGVSLTPPAALQGASVQEIRLSLQTLAANASSIISNIPVTKPAGGPQSCEAEVGASPVQADYGDLVHSSCSRVQSPTGIFANYDFPGKSSLTCIKNQGWVRSTCHTFADTSAVEQLVARQYGKHVNLNEEDLQEHDHQIWSFAPFVESGSAFNELVNAAANNYQFAYEKQWDYNPSYSRVDLKSYPFYQQSCNNYPSTEPGCSDTSTQGPGYCLPEPSSSGPYFCALSPAILPGSVSPYAALPPIPIYFPGNSCAGAASDGSCLLAVSLPLMKMMLAAQAAVVLQFHVKNHAWSQTPNSGPLAGIISWPPSCSEKSCPDQYSDAGGHAVHVVAAIDNHDLAKLAPLIPIGDGGGYLVIKDSEGTCRGDAGYLYIPYGYFAHFATDLFFILGVYKPSL